MRIAIGIPTLGRAPIVLETLAELRRQTRPADRIIVCYARENDVPPRDRRPPDVEWLPSDPGSCRQRNSIIDHVTDCEMLLFLDDDFVPRADYLAVMERLFAERPGVVVATGTVLADGARGSGISFAEARDIIARDQASSEPMEVATTANGYGCNMAVRLSVLHGTGLRFDESLPLYAWQEDAELSCRLGTHGAVVRIGGARGVHLGVKMGRSPGLQLGYSQVINPLYIARRVPSYTMRRAVAQIGRNLAANLVHALRPEPWIDRRGRLRGNLIGLVDAIRGRLAPDRVLSLGHLARRADVMPALGLGGGAAAIEDRPGRYQRVPPR